MAKVGQIVVESRRYSGWEDPRYPIGFWQAALNVTGDATGGLLAIDLVFQSSIPPRLNSQMYSVERISIQTNDTSDRNVQLKAVNMGGPANKAFEQEYAVFIQSMATIATGAILANMTGFLPWFLGSQRQAGTTSSLSMIAANSNDVQFEFEAEGYRWGARSVLVDGGPQRPPTGLYRQ